MCACVRAAEARAHRDPWSRYTQVALGLLLIIELLTPMRNLLFLFMYWQFLQLRYVLSPQMKVRKCVRGMHVCATGCSASA